MSLLRSQQRELAELRQNQMELMQRLTDHLDAVQSSLMGHMERVIDSQQEQERILPGKPLLEASMSQGQAFWGEQCCMRDVRVSRQSQQPYVCAIKPRRSSAAPGCQGWRGGGCCDAGLGAPDELCGVPVLG